MTKSPAHWEKPASDKGSAAQEQKQLKPGKSDLTTPRDMDWHYAGKQQGVGFSGNATAVVHHGPDNPAAVDYRNPPQHNGANSGPARVAIQNTLASKRKQ
jgi:hypothetical protein